MIDIIRTGELLPLVGAIIIVVWLGKAYAGDKQKLAGGFIAIVCFLAYAGYVFDRYPPPDAQGVFDVALRALITFGLSLGSSWIVLALVTGMFHPIAESMRRGREKVRQRPLPRPATPVKPPPKPVPPPLPTPTREELLEEAERQFQKDVEFIDKLPLDDEEKTLVKEKMRRSFLQKIEGLLK